MNLRERIARLRAEAGGDPRFTELVEILEKLEAQARRTQAEQSRLEERLARVENSAIFRALRAAGQAGANAKGRLGQALLRSPLHPLYARFSRLARDADPAYAVWIADEQRSMLPVPVLTEESRSWPYQPRISILMPVYRPRREWIEAAIRSVQAQSYENWQLCVCCDGPAEPWLDDWLRRRVSEDARFRVAFAAERCGIASALNGAGTLADGEYLAFLDQDDVLAVTALHFIAGALQYEQADILYSDEDWMNEAGQRVRPNFKPDWSPELLSGCMYFGHLFVAKRERVSAAGWFHDGFEGAQDYDLALRLAGNGASVRHVPRVLYHWRMHEGSTAAVAGAKPACSYFRQTSPRARAQGERRYGFRSGWPDAAHLRRALGARARRCHDRHLFTHSGPVGAMSAIDSPDHQPPQASDCRGGASEPGDAASGRILWV